MFGFMMILQHERFKEAFVTFGWSRIPEVFDAPRGRDSQTQYTLSRIPGQAAAGGDRGQTGTLYSDADAHGALVVSPHAGPL